MSIVPEYLELAEEVAAQIKLPKIARLYLPDLQETDDVRDEFGLLFLEGGVVAPFYTSLPGTIQTLWQKYPAEQVLKLELIELIRMLDDSDLANRAVALGAFNAMSQFVMRRGELLPLDEQSSANMGSAKPRRGETVGMVGYFCPLIDKLIEKGVNVLVLEKQPERVIPRPGLRLCKLAADLASCRIVLCTAATLINDSVDDILAHCTQAENFSIIGPSGSGLPDILFARGVHSVGGVYFPDHTALDQRLRSRESWGDAGTKYQLTPATYPGYRELLNRLTTGNINVA